jgi:hypothetical protein
MPPAAEARAWWSEVEEVRARIEERRSRENQWRPRPVRELSQDGGLALSLWARSEPSARAGAEQQYHAPAVRRPRPRPTLLERVGPHPDRVAACAAALGFLLVLVAILSAH